jgi:3-carboxy-cis,cis-muconate cycloisomerase
VPSRRQAHPLTPVIAVHRASTPEIFAQYVHFGATTQDIMDTGTVLQVRDGLGGLDTGQPRHASHGLHPTRQDAGVTCPWRAAPTVSTRFPLHSGLKFALWAQAADTSVCGACRTSNADLAVQFAGAAGTLATLGTHGAQVRANLAAELELRDPGQSWHTSRQQFATLVSQLAIAAGAICGQDRQRDRQPAAHRNRRTELRVPRPVLAARPPCRKSATRCWHRTWWRLARLMASKPAAAIEATMHEHERDMAAWTMEWAVIPESFVLTHAALDQTVRLVENVVVNEDRIAANLATHRRPDLR